ncbi:MAG: hypothetical protein GY838_08725 [bacterium]|nr:hypothetical protein [bacterium]
MTACALALLAVAAATAAAAPVFEPLTRAREVSTLLELDGKVFGGTGDGGVFVWDADDPGQFERWTAGTQLGSARVVDLAWTGRYLWVATDDGGLTRVEDPASDAPSFRQIGSTMSTFATTAVAGLLRGDQERVWYGLGDGGLGEITDGFDGSVYTTSDGLVSDTIRALHIHDGELWIGTPAGISRFADGVFHDATAGLAGLNTRVFVTDTAGDLFAAGSGGVHRWDSSGEAWVSLGGIGRTVVGLAVVADDLYALGAYAGGTATLHRWNGTGFDDLALPEPRTLATGGGTAVWLGGRIDEPGMQVNRSGLAFYARLDAGGATTVWQPALTLPANCAGVTFGADGRPWLGSRWGEAFSGRRDDGTWENIYEIATVANDSSGLINQIAPILAMATGADGVVWVPQTGSGVLRHDPATGRTDQIRPFNSGLSGNSLIGAVGHPDGPVLFLHDWLDTDDKVDVLVDPVHWRNPANWLSLPLGSGGLGDGPNVWDAHVARRDQIWFAVEGTGLVRWDVNGLSAGPDDPLTWLDQSDDHWTAPVNDFPNTFLDPTQARGIDDGPGGSLWVGGNGVVRFRYDGGLITTLDDLGTAAGDEGGLSNSRVYDVATDRHGYLWVANASGLDRVRLGAGDPVVDSWFDALTYATDGGINGRYLSTAIADMPGSNYDFARLALDSDRGRLLHSGDRGVSLVDVGGPVGAASGSASAQLYPNPWRPELGDGLLRIGGLGVEPGETVEVGIYTVEGQLVYQDPTVAPDTGFWRGVNRVGNPVATGLYVVKVSWRGEHLMRTLAVVR